MYLKKRLLLFQYICFMSSDDDADGAVFQFLYGACKMMMEFNSLLKLNHSVRLRKDLLRTGALGFYNELTQTDDELWGDDEPIIRSRTPSPVTFLRASMSPSSSFSTMMDADDDDASVGSLSPGRVLATDAVVDKDKKRHVAFLVQRVHEAISHLAQRSDEWADALVRLNAYQAVLTRFVLGPRLEIDLMAREHPRIFCIRFWESVVLPGRSPFCIAHLDQSRAMAQRVLLPRIKEWKRLGTHTNVLYELQRTLDTYVLDARKKSDDFTNEVVREFAQGSFRNLKLGAS